MGRAFDELTMRIELVSRRIQGFELLIGQLMFLGLFMNSCIYFVVNR